MDNTEKALQILKAAEIKESDFKSESIYNTIVGNIIMLLLEQDKMKEALFQRNQIIQDLDQEIQELDKRIEEQNDEIEQLKADNERLFNALPIELARGFSLWLLCNYFTPEPGEDLCWINAETGTKHYNSEVFEIYLNGLK